MTRKMHVATILLFSVTMLLKIYTVIALCSMHSEHDIELAHEHYETTEAQASKQKNTRTTA